MKIIIKTIFLLPLFVFSCNSNDDNNDFDSDVAELSEMRTAIENLIGTSICNDNTECLFIAFGSKPCGGPWSYLIYSSSINTNLLEEMVEDFNIKQATFNLKYNQFSDCAFVSPPTGLDCENNVCVPLN